MHRDLTPSTWKVWSDEMAKLKAKLRRCHAVLRLSRPQVSERSKLLGCWRTSRLVSPLSCLSSFWWVVHHFYNSGLVLVLSSILQLLDPSDHCDGIMSVMCQKVRELWINPYISIIVNSLQTDIQTYIHTYIQTQPQTKTPLAPATLARLWAAC